MYVNAFYEHVFVWTMVLAFHVSKKRGLAKTTTPKHQTTAATRYYLAPLLYSSVEHLWWKRRNLVVRILPDKCSPDLKQSCQAVVFHESKEDN
jgi:hypothetical protein